MTPEQMGEAAAAITGGILGPVFLFLFGLALFGFYDKSGIHIHIFHHRDADDD